MASRFRAKATAMTSGGGKRLWMGWGAGQTKTVKFQADGTVEVTVTDANGKPVPGEGYSYDKRGRQKIVDGLAAAQAALAKLQAAGGKVGGAEKGRSERTQV